MNMKHRVKSFSIHIFVFFKWMALAALVGTLMGGIGSAFRFCIERATELREENSWLLSFLPVAGVRIAVMYVMCGMKIDRGTNLVITSVRTTENPPLRLAPLIFIGTIFTHLCGGSAGREGAAIQLGGSVASNIGKLFHLDQNDQHMITMCGMSAAFAALFGTPLTAAIFSMEVVSVGVMYYAAIVPCVIASLIGNQIALAFGAAPVGFDITGIPSLNLISAGQVILLAALCGGVSILFCVAMHSAGKLYDKVLPNRLLQAIVGGVLVVVLTLIFQTYDYNGIGTDVILRATQGEVKPEAFLLKILFTAVTLGAGFKGGEIVPALFTGATFGGTVGPLIGLSASFGSSIGMIGLFCGVVNCPLSALLMSIELFGIQGIGLYAITAAVSYMLSGYYGLYSSQKIMYSKLKTKYINQDTK